MLRHKTRSSRSASTPRNSVRTRERLLHSAFSEIYKSGYQGTDLDTILSSAGVTKGALYHHFENKESLGYAIVDEVIAGITRDKWLQPLQNTPNPLNTLIEIVESTSIAPSDLRGGCPLNNLAQEMSPLDEGFRKRIAKVFADWHGAIVTALKNGQKSGQVRREIDVDDTATFFIAVYEGYISITKNSQDAKMMQSGKRSIVHFLEGLRVPSVGKGSGDLG
ncbi:MAG TPA: TetR/AcrR family transcriptional regulator [Candidatus Acidoferrum sp.]|jgi:AcrR family transcriptional regulator